MLAATKRITFGAAVVALAVGLSGCSGLGGPAKPDTEKGAPGAKKAPGAPKNVVQLIGDGSTAYTGTQPGLLKPQRLKPGEKPPQFVVFSWDGAGEDSQKLFSHFRDVGKKYNATMTYFLSGLYLLPEDKAQLYDPPQHLAGSSEIGFNDTKGIKDTLRELRGAWRDGNEIGTHFNGHFCGENGGVGTWSVDEWKSEISQAKAFVKSWKTNSGLKNEPPLPFDYDKELVGGRTPCLEGQKNMVIAGRSMGFRYDSSGVGDQVWPKLNQGLWDMPLQLVPVPGRAFETISMDYNFMFNQSGVTQGDPSLHAYWGDQMRDGLFKAFDRTYHGNRAPLIIGNHFESWNGGTYMRAVEQTIKTVCVQREVRCVSFRQLADWLDAQDPQTLEKLRGLGVGEAPKAGWNAYLTPTAAAAGPAASDASPSASSSPAPPSSASSSSGSPSSGPAPSDPASPALVPSQRPSLGGAPSEADQPESEGDQSESDQSEGVTSEEEQSGSSSPEDASAETAEEEDPSEAPEQDVPEGPEGMAEED